MCAFGGSFIWGVEWGSGWPRFASGILGVIAEDFHAAWRSGAGKQSPFACKGLELCLGEQELPKQWVQGSPVANGGARFGQLCMCWGGG